MLSALNSNAKKVFGDDARREEHYYCPLCQQKVVLRKGEQRRAHFAHMGQKTDNYTQCTDHWHYDMTQWHMDWQCMFPKECVEIVINKNGKKHIADVLINNTVIEFQHSHLSATEFVERTNFYYEAGYNVVWVFDLEAQWTKGQIHEEFFKKDRYKWTHVKDPFRKLGTGTVQAQVYFQVSNKENEAKAIQAIESATQGFSTYHVKQEHAFSAKSFFETLFQKNSSYNGIDCLKIYENADLVDECMLRVASTTGRNSEESSSYSHDKFEGVVFDFSQQSEDGERIGKTIRELWNRDYKYIVVRDLTKMQEMIIYGRNGEPSTNRRGDIIGYYSHKGRDGKFHYSERSYKVWNSDRPIWQYITSKMTEESQLRKTIQPIPGSTHLYNIFQSSLRQNVVVKSNENGRYYSIDFKLDNRGQYQISAVEIDIETGEILPANPDNYIQQRLSINIWESVKPTD